MKMQALTLLACVTMALGTCVHIHLHDNGRCFLSQRPSTLEEVTACKDHICSELMDKWSRARITDTQLVLEGDGYGCVIVNSTEPTAENICSSRFFPPANLTKPAH